MKNAKSWVGSVKQSRQYEVPEYSLLETLQIEKLTTKQRQAKQMDAITPKAPKVEAQPDQPDQPGPKAKPRANAGPKGPRARPLSEPAAKAIEKLQGVLQTEVQAAETEMGTFDPDNNENDKTVPKRFLDSVQTAMAEASEVDGIISGALALKQVPEGTTMTALRLRTSSAAAALDKALDKIQNARAD